ncbi:RING finger protein B [Paragonimus heterotremus]|uniref:RING finger protein B n=1 Tax=Paragonimus heterotremus TaxID=100268 RepID=A0A8J4T5X1_9TREM|nr:RING finger protein B [Paragonimus heterotremus]
MKDDDSKISSPNKQPSAGSNKPTARHSRPISRVDSSKRPPQKLKQHPQHIVGSSLDSKLSSAGSSPSEKRDRRLSTAVKSQLDVDLSSLSSLHSESSASSSPTPPMSSCNSLFTGNPEDAEPRRGSMVSQSSPKLVAKPKSDKQVNGELTKKKVTSNRPSVEETALPKQPPSHQNISPASVKHSQESEETENVASSTQRKETTREPSKYSNQQLELLFDRLLRLRQPHLAARMGEILLQYLTPRSPKATSKSQTKGDSSDKLGKSNRAVKVLHSEVPRVIAFNLRKLPITCLDQLSGLIAEDESIPDEIETEPTGRSVTTA